MTENLKEYAITPLFVLPNDLSGLTVCILLFLCVSFLIYILERVWIRGFVFRTDKARKQQRILMWEFGTIVAIIVIFLLKQYCVVLPLLFFLAFLTMWYLVRVIGR